MTFHFAWVAPTETVFGPAHQREDEQVFAFRLEHGEGDFPTLSIDIRNSRRQLLDEGADVWVWLSEDATPLFFGRLVAVPEDLHAEIVRLDFVARPSGYDATKRALAETLRVAPFWDPVWIRDERLDDPDAVLEARSQLWHIDRATHAVTVSDIIAGEDGTLDITEHEYGSLRIAHGAPPLHRVRVEAEVFWDQTASGTLDLTQALIAGFGAAGSPPHLISSWTGQGLAADWPEEGADLKGGWSVGRATLERADGVWKEPRFKDVRVGSGATLDGGGEPGAAAEAFVSAPVTARFHLWEFRPHLALAYDVARPRIERVSFALAADVQPVFSEPGDEEELVVALGSRKVSEEVAGALPLGDLRRSAYLRTDRGRRSLDYPIALARAKLLARARAVEIEVTVPFGAATGLSCRHSATITDDRIPGGSASGKVIGYVLRADGNGERRAEIRIGCTIGEGTSVAADPGTPAYVDDGYADPGWQLRTGETIMAVAGEAAYSDLSGTAVQDDGIDFFQLRPADVIQRLDVVNGEAAQAAVLDQRFEDIPAAVEALNDAFTEVVLDLKPLTGGPFETDYALTVTPLAVPRTLTL